MKLLLALIPFILLSVRAEAEMLKCVNGKGDLAFSQSQCPDGYHLYGTEQESQKRFSSGDISDGGWEDVYPNYPDSTVTSVNDNAVRAAQRRAAENRQQARRELHNSMRKSLESSRESCPPMTEWKARMSCLDRVNKKLKEFDANPDFYISNRMNQEPQRGISADHVYPAEEIPPRGSPDHSDNNIWANGNGAIDTHTGERFETHGGGYRSRKDGRYIPDGQVNGSPPIVNGQPLINLLK